METAIATTQGGIPTTPKSKKPLYTVYKNKDGVEFKVINFDNEEIVPNKGIVEFEAFKKQDYQRLRETKFACPVVKDATTGIYYGLFGGFHPNGDPKWMDIPLGMVQVYDRSIPAEAKKSFILANSPLTEGSPNAKLGRLVKFRLVDREKAADDKIKKIADGKRALAIAESLYGEGLMNMARDLGLTMHSSYTMLTAEVQEYALEKPVDFLKIAEHPNREAVTVLNKAIHTRVVEQDHVNGLMYNGLSLGHNFDWGVKYLIENPSIMMSINLKASERQAETDKTMQLNTTEVTEEKSVNLEVEALKAELAKAKAEKDALLLQQSNGAVVSNNPLEQELEDLKVIAKDKKLRGVHTYKATPESIAKLRKAIEDKK